MIWLFCSVALLAEVAPPTFRYLPDLRAVLESSTPDAVIRYTFEDRDPDKSAGVYFGPARRSGWPCSAGESFLRLSRGHKLGALDRWASAAFDGGGGDAESRLEKL